MIIIVESLYGFYVGADLSVCTSVEPVVLYKWIYLGWFLVGGRLRYFVSRHIGWLGYSIVKL